MDILYFLLYIRDKLKDLALEVNSLAVAQAENVYYKNLAAIQKLEHELDGRKTDNDRLYVYISENKHG